MRLSKILPVIGLFAVGATGFSIEGVGAEEDKWLFSSSSAVDFYAPIDGFIYGLRPVGTTILGTHNPLSPHEQLSKSNAALPFEQIKDKSIDNISKTLVPSFELDKYFDVLSNIANKEGSPEFRFDHPCGDYEKKAYKESLIASIKSPVLVAELLKSIDDVAFSARALDDIEARQKRYSNVIGPKRLDLSQSTIVLVDFQNEAAGPRTGDSNYSSYNSHRLKVRKIEEELDDLGKKHAEEDFEEMVDAADRDLKRAKNALRVLSSQICISNMHCPFGFECKIDQHLVVPGQWVVAGQKIMRMDVKRAN